MSEGSVARGFRQQDDKDQTAFQSYDGVNRRTVGLLPDGKYDRSSIIPIAGSANRHRFLLSLEASQQSGCIKIASNKRKSRGAVLMFRGRVLGSVYGSKTIDQQLFDQVAYSNVSIDIANNDCTIDAYTLPEELVIAAASLFHGQQFQVDEQASPAETFKSYLQVLIDSNMPGCAVFNDHRNAPVCIAYVFAGKLVGLYAVREGWLPPTLGVALAQIAKYKQASIAGSMLKARNIDEVLELTFSLSGLADRQTESWTGLQLELEKSFRVTTMTVRKFRVAEAPVQQDRFIPTRGRKVMRNHQGDYRNLYSVNP